MQANPYDFSNPVADAKLFAGREAQLREIDYYIGQAAVSNRPSHLAVIGPRGAGKTSLLNMLALRAVASGLCVVRVDLDEGDATSQLRFFHKLVDCLFLQALRAGAWGGWDGPTRRAYLRAIYGADRSAADELPIELPRLYALAASRGNWLGPTSNDIALADLLTIQRELNVPVVLVLDECNVLASAVEILQKLRNVFMKTERYMLVICGTPELFPTLDDVFSPITRQFKRIPVDAFTDPADTRRCVMGPLEAAGLDPLMVLDQKTYQELDELHRLAGGRPYEVQLLCHHMFRRWQTGEADKMRLDLSILEDVRRHMEREQGLVRRPILNAVRSMDDEQLTALGVLVPGDGTTSFRELWSTEYAFRGTSKFTEASLQSHLDALVSNGVLDVQDGRIRFAGDEFDRMYTTYFANEREIPLFFLPSLGSLNELNWFIRLSIWFGQRRIQPMGAIRRADSREASEIYLIDVLNAMSGISSDAELLKAERPLVRELYWITAANRGKLEVPIWRARLRVGSLDFSVWLKGKAIAVDDIRTRVLGDLALVQARIGELKGSLEISEFPLPIYRLDKVIQTIAAGEVRLKTELATVHADIAIDEYLGRPDHGEALFHADCLVKLEGEVFPPRLVNVGYILLANGEVAVADRLFAAASGAADGDPLLTALLTYNRAVAAAQQGDFARALVGLSGCIALAESMSEEDRQMAKLLVGDREGGRLRFTEIDHPDLLSSALATRRAILEAQEAIGA